MRCIVKNNEASRFREASLFFRLKPTVYFCKGCCIIAFPVKKARLIFAGTKGILVIIKYRS